MQSMVYTFSLEKSGKFCLTIIICSHANFHSVVRKRLIFENKEVGAFQDTNSNATQLTNDLIVFNKRIISCLHSDCHLKLLYPSLHSHMDKCHHSNIIMYPVCPKKLLNISVLSSCLINDWIKEAIVWCYCLFLWKKLITAYFHVPVGPIQWLISGKLIASSYNSGHI